VTAPGTPGRRPGEPPEPGILHVDLDAFFASVEQLDHPELRGRPVIVGGTGPRGVVAAASYEARTFGVFSAMPVARARRLCPDGVYLPSRYERYAEKSREVMAILRSCTPLVEPLASDEAFLDVRGARRLLGAGPEIGALVKRRVRAETGLTASVGVATTKLLAKLASDLSKPDGLLVVEPERELAFLHPLPASRLWGVGPATQQRLERLGIRTIGDIARSDPVALARVLGGAAGRHLHALAHNHDDRAVEPDQEVKSIGTETTFPEDLVDGAAIEREVRRLADSTATRLRKAARTGRTVTLKLRFGDFRTITRSATLAEPTDETAVLVNRAVELVRTVGEREGFARGVRLLGVTASNLAEAQAAQGSLFDQPQTPDRLDAVVDDLRARFGATAVGRAGDARPARAPRGASWGARGSNNVWCSLVGGR
jgi:DNA polymerase-4